MKNGPGLKGNGRRLLSDTGIGNPKKANAEKGEKCYKEVISKISGLMTDLCDSDINNMYE